MTRTFSHPRGSILIWTVLLGISLMTIFFYFSQRLNLNAAFQKRSLEYQNTQAFLTSYADYLEALPANQIQSEHVDYQGITGFITNVSTDVVSELDDHQFMDYEIKYGKVKVEWGRCAYQEVGRELEITPNDGMATGNCGVLEYDGVSEVSDSIFKLKAGEAPVGYRLTPIGTAILHQSEWTLDLQLDTPSGRTLTLHRNFIKAL